MRPARSRSSTLPVASEDPPEGLDESSRFDWAFERLLPPSVQAKSEIYWTPVAVIRKAMEMLAPQPPRYVLDVGSGPGKFCILASLMLDAQFVGIERKRRLVTIAQHAAREVNASRTRFICGNALNHDWSGFDVIYFYNPFQELSWEDPSRAEDGYELYQRYALAAKRKLATLAVGTRVLLYHGLGCEMPDGYSYVKAHSFGLGHLELWIRTGELDARAA
ncbi:MAG: class I SAM-dependent methyltransferase [Deltaproteobacteria bacterium]|nr:class I SAM-dependent methyltransferase [Deltaproteobacteria bacterium]